VRALRRSLMGGTNANPPSRFLKNIPSNLVQTTGLFGEEPKAAPKPKVGGPDLSAGDHVEHSKFGKGVVVSCTPARDDQEVVVVFDGAGIKKLLLSLAQLKRVD
jgi:DNA helicase-2/ATP-dependent DNA helicase PcrA